MSSNEITVLAALLAGFAGSVHCIAMCGGIVGVITATLKENASRSVQYWFGYHLGRISSYCVAGALAGIIGEQVYGLFSMQRAHHVGAMISGLFIIVLGMHIAQWWKGLALFEKMGAHLWRYVSPILTRFLPPRALRHAFIVGIIWGWLPCGLVYSALFLAAASGNGIHGAAVMFAFGIGTLPMLLAMSAASDWLARARTRLWLRNVFGTIVCGLGVSIFLELIPLQFGHPSV